ncbi:MAG: DUF1697 domain-containing protein [Candidatus Manganitrophus sp.]|nr:DUF1697 domain-containing protein [Candidatus Manganitrophus sp.]MDC4227069.1 DUF1697 domain-containing protein [Candidatus Manganitrophus sp.]WDT71796.1 MAG: DUF1697 domain-containing protein [Candidatus Manganitrophus sp.]WDT80823.1 MAG: DUF1697 domain-containing protein [Candidatus Manganitrophus sp.]
MLTFVALLRGINVSGRKKIRMADLQKSFEALGFDKVRSYLQSGNVIFRSRRTDPKKLASDIKARIAEDFGYDVDILVLSAKEINRVAGSNPLFPRLGKDATLFHATFLFQPVSKADFEKLNLPAQPGEQAVLLGQVVLLFCPNGYGRTKLNNSFFEKKLGVPATTRNWRTVLALQDLCRE